MAPVAVQMKIATCANVSRMNKGRIAGSKPSVLAAKQMSRHVVRATKVVDMENSVKPEKEKKNKHEDDDEDDGSMGLSPQQVEDFLNVLCEETDIAEVELKMGGFKMKVRRSLKGGAAAAAAAPAPVAAAAAPAPAAYAPAPSSEPPSEMESSFDEDDGSVIEITAPKVGTLRRGRYLKGKQIGKAPAIEVGDKVKKGQVVAYIEQLGTHFPVECPQAGEVAAFLVEEGAAVEYREPILEIAPFFGGHIIGDSKYA